MKKSILLALVTLIAVAGIKAQTTVFSDDFEGTTSGLPSATITTGTFTTGTTPSMTYSYLFPGGNNPSISIATVSTTKVLQYTNGSSSPAAGEGVITGPVSSFGSPFNATLGSNTGLVTWVFNMRASSAAAQPFGGGTNGNAHAVILCATTTTPLTTGNGYAVIATASGNYSLYKFTGGLDGTKTIIGTSTYTNSGSSTQYEVFKVTYNPTGNNWSFFAGTPSSTLPPDPATATFVQAGTTTADNTYTSSAMSTFGFAVRHATTSGRTFAFDNFKCSVTVSSTNFYNAPNTDITNVANWSTNTNGLGGTQPSNFTSASQTFNITNTGSTIPSSWTVSGTGSTVVVGDGTNAVSVTASAAVTLANVLTVKANATYAQGSATLTTTGGATITGTFQLNNGGWATSGTWTYGAAGTLVFNNSSGSYGVNSGDVFWPTASGPVNVTVQNGGGMTLNSGANRTVTGVFQTTGAGVTLSSATLTLNGTNKINAGGFFNNAPIYGAASTLIYNIGASYGRGAEWNATGAGTIGTTAGYPNNVQTSTSGTVLDLGNGGSGTARALAGSLTIDAGTTVSMNVTAMTAALTVAGSLVNNGTLALSGSSGGDMNIAGNWTKGTGATFTPNGRAVFFTGAAAQTITSSASGSETFSYFIVSGAGGVKLSSATPTSVTVNGSTGDVLQLNAGTTALDINGQTFTISGGGNINVNAGARTITSTTTGASLVVTGGTVTVINGGSLAFAANVSVKLSNGMNFGSGLSTISGTLQINSGGFVTTNAAKYANGSLLQYNSNTSYARNTEWTAASGTVGTTAGYPYNVQVSNNTTLNVPNGSVQPALAIGNNLTIDAGSSFYQDFGSPTTSNAITVNGSISIAGNLSLGNNTGGDLNLVGNWTHTTGTFSPNGRAVFFNGATGDQTITNTGGETFDFVIVNKATSGNVVLANAVTINQTLTLTKGLVVLGANNLTFGTTSGNSTGASTASYIATTGAGRVLKTHTGTFTYQVGPNLTFKYAPVVVNNSGTSQTYTIGVAATTYTATTDAALWQWTVGASSTSSTSLGFTWLSADAGANLTANPTAGKAFNFNGTTWTNIGGTTTGTPNVTTVTGITSFTNTIWTVALPPVIYYNVANSDVSVLANWGINTDGTGSHPGSFTANSSTYNLFNGTTNTLGTSTTFSGTGSSLVIGDGTNAVAISVATTLTANLGTTVAANGTLTIAPTTGAFSIGSGSVLAINGTVINSNTLTFTGSASLNAGGTYVHNTTSSATTALAGFTTVNAASTWIYRGSSVLTPSTTFSGRTYGNLTFESTSGLMSISGTGASALTINGSLNVGGSGAGTATFSIPTFSGAVNIAGGVTIVTGGTFAGPASTVSVGGNWSNSGTFTPGTSTISFTGTAVQTITGNTTFNVLNINNTSGTALSTAGAGTGAVVINAGTTVTVGTAASSVTRTAGNLLVKGTITSPGTSTSAFAASVTSSLLGFASTGVYNATGNGGQVPPANWNAASTINITGITSVGSITGGAPASSYGNIFVDLPGYTAGTQFKLFLNWPNTINIAGNLTLGRTTSTSGSPHIVQIPSGSNGNTVNVTGNVNVYAGDWVLNNFTTVVWTINGNLNIDATFNIGATGYTNPTFEVNTSGSTSTTVNLKGNLALTSGANAGTGGNQVANLFNSGTNTRDFIFNGTSAQTITTSATSVTTGAINLQVNNSAGVTLSGNFTTTGNLNLNTGDFTIGSGTLSTATVSRTSGNFKGSVSSNLTITGTGSSLFFTSGGTNNYLKNFTIGASGSATLGNALNITDFDGTSSEGVLTVTPGGTLTTGGFLTIKSSASGTARIATGATGGSYISGNVIVERYIPQNASKAWRLLASNTSGQTVNAAWQEGQVGWNVNTKPGYGTMIPAAGASVGAVNTLGFDTLAYGGSIFKYNPTTDNLDPVTNTLTQSLGAEQGYFLFIRGDRGPNQFNTGVGGTPTAPTSSTVLRSIGTLFMGDQSAVTTGASKYALVRNPYPSRIDLRSVARTGTLIDAYQVWDPKLGGTYGVGAYQTLTKNPGTGHYENSTSGGSYGNAGTVNDYVESGSAFFIQSTSAASGSAQVVEACKTGASGSAVVNRPAAVSDRLYYSMYAINSNSTDVIDGGYIDFSAAYTNDVDILDVRKSPNFAENFGITNAGFDLVVERRALLTENDTIFFSISGLKQQQYKIQISPEAISTLNLNAYLEDLFLNTSTQLSLVSVSEYTFTVTAVAGSKAANRFRIVFKNQAPLPVTIASIRAYSQGSNIAVEWKVESQVNITQYEIEKSLDGRNFTKVGTQLASNSNSASVTYNWIDVNAVRGANYFRVKCVDNDGRYKYTAIVKVILGNVKPSVSVWPNPVEGNTLNVILSNQEKGTYQIRLINNLGQVLLSREAMHPGGNATLSFNLPSQTVKGIYQLELVVPDKSKQVQKVLVQ